MMISRFIEKYFWIFLIAGIVAGLWQPLRFHTSVLLPRILLGMMLFLVFLKIDVLEVIENLKDYRLMAWVTGMYMIIIPLILFIISVLFDRKIAIAVLLLASMPAGVSTPALTDILKGNVSLAMSIALVTQIVAPVTVPVLFWLIGTKSLEIDKLLLFRDIAILVFVPLLLAQVSKRYFPAAIKRNQHLFTSANVFLLFSFVYVAISSQRDLIVGNPASLLWKTLLLYLIFIVLHLAGYLICYRKSTEDKIALSVTSAYMNNGLAIVLASAYFEPDILVMMVLSELPWNTLLAPFRRVVEKLNRS